MEKGIVLYNSDIVDEVHKLMKESSKVKTGIFKANITNRPIDQSIIKSFMLYVNNFLRYWEEVGNNILDEMKSVDGTVGIRAVKYEFAKEYIYCKYDYAAVLQFADGVITGCESNKFEKPDNVEDFFAHTVSKAFNDQPSTIASLLDSVLVNGDYPDRWITSDVHEKSMFNAVRSYKMFNSNDRVEIYNAISETIKYIIDDKLPKNFISINKMPLFISVINNIMDFAVYTLTAYAARIFVINQYASCYIVSSSKYVNVNKPANEKVKFESADTNIDTIEITMLRDADESMCKDITHVKEFMKLLSEFTTIIGADRFFDKGKPNLDHYYYSSNDIGHNIFHEKLMNNPLYKLIVDERSFFAFGVSEYTDISEFHQLLKTYIFNDKQGIQGISTPRQEILHVIRGSKYDDTLKGYQQLAAELMGFAYMICVKLEGRISGLVNRRKSGDPNQDNKMNIDSMISEILRFTSDLYKEIATAIIYKGRDIETKYNSLHANSMNRIISGVTIKIPMGKSNIKQTTDDMTNAVPDTTRIPIELMDMYTLPAFESFQMYNEYLRTLPEFDNDAYLSESVSDLINKLQAILQSISKRVRDFFNNEKTKAAFKWVTDNKDTLLSFQFNGDDVVSNCPPFKDNITLPDGYINLINGLNNFSEKNIESDQALDSFIKSLYPNETVYGWFNSKESNPSDKSNPNGKDRKETPGEIKFKNLMLFQDINQVTAEPPAGATYRGSQLTEQFKKWVATIEDARKTFTEYESLDKQVQNGFNKVKSTIVSFSNKQKTQQNTDQSKSENPDGNGNQKPDKSTETKISIGGNTSNGSISDRAISEITIVIKNIWNPIGKLITYAIYTQYRNIKGIYNQKKSSNQ